MTGMKNCEKVCVCRLFQKQNKTEMFGEKKEKPTCWAGTQLEGRVLHRVTVHLSGLQWWLTGSMCENPASSHRNTNTDKTMDTHTQTQTQYKWTCRHTNVTHHTADRLEMIISSQLHCKLFPMCQIFLESVGHTKSHQSLSNPPSAPPPRPHPHPQHPCCPHPRLGSHYIFASWSKQLSSLIGSICAIKIKFWKNHSAKCPSLQFQWNLEIYTNILPEVSQLLFQTCALLETEMGGSVSGWSRADSGSGPFLCLLGFLQVLRFPPTVQEHEH